MVIRAERTGNFSIMANHHFRNRDLSLKAMGLLSLMLSLPETWDYTLSGLAKICRDGISSVRSAVKELEEKGYVVRRRIRNDAGQLVDVQYTIMESPEMQSELEHDPHEEPPIRESVLPSPSVSKPTPSPALAQAQPRLEHDPYEKPPIRESVLPSPSASNPTPSPALAQPPSEQPTLGFPTLDNHAQISTKESISTESIKDPNKKDRLIDMIDTDRKKSEQTVRNLIQKNIELDTLCHNHRYQTDIAKEMVELMVETICSAKPLIRVNAEYLPKEMVVQRLKAITYADMEYALECFDVNAKRVANIRSYLLTLLYNTKTSIKSYYQNRVRCDLYGIA